MHLKVKINYRDDTEKEFWCADFPSVSDWITLYLENLKRIIIPKEAVKDITIEILDKK